METAAEKASIRWTFTSPLVGHRREKTTDGHRYSYYLCVPPHIVDHLGLADADGRPNSLVKWSIEAWLIQQQKEPKKAAK